LDLINLDVFITIIYLDLKISITLNYNMFLEQRHPTEQHEIFDGIVAVVVVVGTAGMPQSRPKYFTDESWLH
tara:strand:+ start:1777 stop:1992 length:216 start_codon:yes stop_codon:yes gene_type:complete